MDGGRADGWRRIGFAGERVEEERDDVTRVGTIHSRSFFCILRIRIGINQEDDMIKVEQSVVIGKPVEEVFAFSQDIEQFVFTQTEGVSTKYFHQMIMEFVPQGFIDCAVC
jgi:hypothetical protein